MKNRTITIPAADGECPSLKEVIDEIASKAEAWGMTAEILESMLDGN